MGQSLCGEPIRHISSGHRRGTDGQRASHPTPNLHPDMRMTVLREMIPDKMDLHGIDLREADLSSDRTVLWVLSGLAPLPLADKGSVGYTACLSQRGGGGAWHVGRRPSRSDPSARGPVAKFRNGCGMGRACLSVSSHAHDGRCCRSASPERCVQRLLCAYHSNCAPKRPHTPLRRTTLNNPQLADRF
jgi:hypothetical protein